VYQHNLLPLVAEGGDIVAERSVIDIGSSPYFDDNHTASFGYYFGKKRAGTAVNQCF
jgi:TRAP-type mannitol/chloroaromatic compound transport system substrate-binding protein